MRIVGNLFPFIGRVIAPCNEHGIPAMDPNEIEAAHFETGAWMVAWFGRVFAFPFGDVAPRMIDPANPRRYAPGNL